MLKLDKRVKIEENDNTFIYKIYVRELKEI